MRSRQVLSWIALCTILALATNGLLFLHLRACHEHACGSPDPSSHHPSHPHDSQTCPICQTLLVHSGKYTTDPPAVPAWTASVEIRTSKLCEFKYSQTDDTPCIPRGPPII